MLWTVLSGLGLLAMIALTPVMMVLGLMSGLSGGGQTPAYQRIGLRLMVHSPFLVLGCLLVGGVAWGLGITPVACGAALVPPGYLAFQMLLLQRETGALVRRRRRTPSTNQDA